MKKTLGIIGLSLLAVVIIVGGLLTYDLVQPKAEQTFGSTDFNVLGGSLTNSATSTGSYCTTCPVKILDQDTSRRYAVITNPNATAVYLYATDSTLTVDGLGGVTATSTITSPLDGIYLAASGGTYEIDADNLITGHLWASSTAASLQINVSYK